MTKDVFVSIAGLQFGEGVDGEKIEIITPGSYYKKNDKHYVVYDEVMEGFEGVTKNMIKFDGDVFSLTKRGVTNVDMVFEKHKRNMTNYITPYGSLLVGIDADTININESDDEISISVDYALDINYEHLADCKIKMDIRAKSEDSIKLLGD